jgi:predicted CXXCH cytochrome family protein
LFGTALSLGPENSFGSGIPQAYEALAAGATMATPTPGPTQAVTPMPTPSGGITMAAYEEFWAYTPQVCKDRLLTTLLITDSANSAIGPTLPDATEAFDTVFASCDGIFASTGYWQVSDFAKANGSTSTSINNLQKVVLSTQFYVSSGWVDDELQLQVSTNSGATWSTLITYNSTTLPSVGSAGGLYIDDISDLVTTSTQLNNLLFRIYGSNAVNTQDTFTIYLDTVMLAVTANLEPAAVIMAPLEPYSAAWNDTTTLEGKATDPEQGDLSANIVWMSNIDGKLGTGATLSVSGLTPGTHSITATVKDSFGQIGTSKSITITITGSSGPHGNFETDTSACALCHRTHSAQAPGELLAYPSSSWDNNDFCLSCHSSGGGAEVVKTHSNKSYPNKIEGDFELLCVQCHDPHGNTGNLFSVRTHLYDGMMPTNLSSMTLLAAPVTFTNLIDTGSLGNTNDETSVCVACHIGKTTNHTGGAGHTGSTNYSGQSCINCHSHSAVIVVGGTPIPNGFMANTPTPTP